MPLWLSPSFRPPPLHRPGWFWRWYDQAVCWRYRCRCRFQLQGSERMPEAVEGDVLGNASLFNPPFQWFGNPWGIRQSGKYQQLIIFSFTAELIGLLGYRHVFHPFGLLLSEVQPIAPVKFFDFCPRQLLNIAMTQSSQGRKQSSPLDDRVKRCTSQRIQFLYGQVFSSAFATLNTFRLGRKVYSQIAVYKSLFKHRLEYREVSGRRIGWYGAGLEPATFGTQQIQTKLFNQLQVNLRKGMVSPLIKILKFS